MNALTAITSPACGSGASANPSAQPARASDPDQDPYIWILNAPIDLLLCCGGFVWILFFVHFIFIGPHNNSPAAQVLLTVGALGSIFLGQTHTTATLVRAYQEDSFCARFPVLTKWLPLALATLALWSCQNKDLPPMLVKIYLLIVSQHFTKQTYGIVLLYCLKRKYTMNLWDRRILSLVMNATMCFAIIRQCTYRAWSGDSFLGQKIPFWGPLPESIFWLSAWLVALTAVLFFGRLLYRLLFKAEVFPLPALMLTVTGIVIFTLGQEMTGTLWIYVPAFFHGSQYLTVTTSVYLKEHGPAGSHPNQRVGSLLLHTKALRYFGFLSLAGIAVFIGIPHILEQFRFSYAMSVAAIFTTMQFHHVAVDHAIWRMKDPRMRNLLVA